MKQTFGEFIEEFPLEHESLELSFTSSRPIEQRWHNNRLSAYFLADYFLSFLPTEKDDTHGEEQIKASKSAVSYVGNELLENAIKFHDSSNFEPVKLGIHLLENLEEVTAVIFTKNSITIQRFEEFQAFIEKLLSTDPDELYIQKVEKTAEDENSEASGLGLLTTINDYSAKLGWKFESDPSNPQMISVITMAQVVV